MAKSFPLEEFVKLLAPFAPHIGEEIWSRLGHEDTIAYETWPEFDAAWLVDDAIELPVSINGKMRAKISVAPDESEEKALELALADAKVQKQVDGKTPKKVIYRAGRMLNIVV